MYNHKSVWEKVSVYPHRQKVKLAWGTKVRLMDEGHHQDKIDLIQKELTRVFTDCNTIPKIIRVAQLKFVWDEYFLFHPFYKLSK
jgi:hypothetical protein